MESSGQIFEAEVTHLSQQGFGVVKGPDRATYFVRGTWRGDRGRFQATEVYDGDYRFAELLELLEPSSERRPSPCPHLGLGPQQCLGCPWMTVDYTAQLQEKQHRVGYSLERVGVRAEVLHPIWPSPNILHYRRRAQFKSNGLVIGYAGRQGLSIAPIQDCVILTPTLQDSLHTLQNRLPNPEWMPGPHHIWNFLDIDESTDLQDLPLNRRRPFQQANADQNAAMRQWLKSKIQERDRSSPVLELFAGAGNFTEIFVELGFEDIKALEVGARAVEEMQQRQWPGVLAQRLDLYGPKAWQELLQLAARSQVLLVNPPRDGMKQLARMLRSLRELQDIFYVSCDPGTFASDARRLVQQGFALVEVQPLDQMPHTPHVEILARFTK